MELHNKDLSTLFEQLGLPADQASMDAFFASHSLAHDTKLIDAPFWNESQARFLAEAVREDAEWAETVDTLSALLRH